MDLVPLKLGATSLLVCARMCVTLASRNCNDHSSDWVELGLVLGQSLAGGVFLATSLVHFIPQVRESLLYLLPGHSLPVTELLVAAGFLSTFLLDETFTSLRSSAKVYPVSDSDSSSSSPSHRTHPPPLARALLLALHAVVKGAALGLALSAGHVWFLFTAAIVYDTVAMVGFSLQLTKLEISFSMVVSFAVFLSLVLVAGVVMGIVVTSASVDEGLTAVVRGLAAGHLLYLTCFHLLPREPRTRAWGLLCWLLVFLAFLLLLLLQLTVVDETKYFEVTPSSSQKPSEEPDYNSYPDEQE